MRSPRQRVTAGVFIDIGSAGFAATRPVVNMMGVDEVFVTDLLRDAQRATISA